jgi:ADP-ribose pyrophosphatase YjhB (NUDIX family)
MVDIGVNVAIIDNGKVLLTKREDFEIWCLPGGEVDPNETLAQTALREAREETGLTIQLTRLVGVYSSPHWLRDGHHSILFAAKPTGGALCLCPGETIEVAYFEFDQLPADLVPWHRQKIRDVIDGIGGSAAWRQDIQWQFPPGMSRQAIYAERDRSGLSRSAYFWQHFHSTEPLTEACEVGGQSINCQP